jgi:hypothetical protein
VSLLRFCGIPLCIQIEVAHGLLLSAEFVALLQ